MEGNPTRREAESPWLTVREAADRLKLKPGTLRNYMSRGLVPFHRNIHTGTVRLRIDEIDSWLMNSMESK